MDVCGDLNIFITNVNSFHVLLDPKELRARTESRTRNRKELEKQGVFVTKDSRKGKGDVRDSRSPPFPISPSSPVSSHVR